jgi:CheY-like chemotaxis protein
MKMQANILIVDDEPEVRFIIKNLLKTKGVQAVEAGSIKECLTTVGTSHVEAIILDIDLPDGSGLDAIPQIKQQAPHAAIVINSALNTDENQRRAMEQGADTFLSKPLNKQALFDALEL